MRWRLDLKDKERAANKGDHFRHGVPVKTYRLKVASEMLQTSEALVAGLAGVRPLSCVAAQVPLQVGLPLHRVRTEGAFEAHHGV